MYGKIHKIVKFNGDTIKFRYGPDGNRVAKEVFSDSLHRWTNTYYVHDAQGNIMATYQWFNKDTFTLDELVMYGSSRLGTIGAAQLLTLDTALHDSTIVADSISYANPCRDSVRYYTNGVKQYELTNHLGNVLLTLTDRHEPVYSGGFLCYRAEVASAQDYYPFGMIMPGRNYRDTTFRFGFNDKEKDNEIEGTGNEIDYGYRCYDSRLGRFLSIDPLVKNYPFYTPYQYASNTPIWAKDIDGLETAVGMAISAYNTATLNNQGEDALNKVAKKELIGAGLGLAAAGTIAAAAPWIAASGEGLPTILSAALGDPVAAYSAFGAGAGAMYGAYEANQVSQENNDFSYAPSDQGNSPSSSTGKNIITPNMTLDERIAVRENLARSYYQQFGEKNIDSKLAGTDFSKPVTVEHLKKGTIVEQWVDKDGNVGKYFAPEGSDKNTLGINTDGRTLRKFEVTEDTKVLKSTAKEYKGNKGGGTQYFSPDLRNKIKPIK